MIGRFSSIVCSSLVLAASLLSSAFGGSGKPSSATGLDIDRLKTIPVRLQALVDNYTLPGVVSLVARHGEIAELDAVGWADIEGRKPMRTDSIFQIMSMTKNFTGVAAMMLMEEGKLELRKNVEDYLPEFKGIELAESGSGPGLLHPPKHPPTVWQLMSHTSGLGGDPDGALKDNPYTMRVPLADAVRFYGSHEHLIFEPGTRWSYSNMGIATLGRIVEVVSGDDYVHFVKSRILDPLGMKDTFYFAPTEKRDRIVMVYKHADGKLVRSGGEILAGDPAKFREGAKYPAPEFGLYSTAPDLFRFYQMLLNGGVYEGRRYLSRQSIETMTRVFTPEVNPSGWMGGTGYGLTFEVVDKPEGTLLLHSPGTFGHGGAFGTEGWIDPKNDLIRIEMVQVSDGTGGAARSVVMQIGEAAVVQ
ncbi:MAG: serine hydrolase domain-containing protein [Bryobacteraceae bacterium]